MTGSKSLTLWKSQDELIEAMTIACVIESDILPRVGLMRVCCGVMDLAGSAMIVWAVAVVLGGPALPDWASASGLLLCAMALFASSAAVSYRAARLLSCIDRMAIDPTPEAMKDTERMMDRIILDRRGQREAS